MSIIEQANPSGAVLMEKAAAIVMSYVSNNSMRATELPDLISAVFVSLKGCATEKVGKTEELAAALVPAVSVKKSITPDFLICLEDGRRFKSLRRHLMSKYGLTPDAYRAKWGLAKDYPMVAPSYSSARSALAKTSGLGQRGGSDDGTNAVETTQSSELPDAEQKAA